MRGRMPFDLPRDAIVPVRSAMVRLDPGQHPFERENAAAIDENWRAELAIRFGVILRKVWGGSRTWAGARVQAVLMSVWRTCWQQQRRHASP